MSRGLAFTVAGLTSLQGILKVLDDGRGLPGVNGVAVDLVRGGESVVRSGPTPGTSMDEVVAAVGDGGFDLTGHWPGVHDSRQDSKATRPGSQPGTLIFRKVAYDVRQRCSGSGGGNRPDRIHALVSSSAPRRPVGPSSTACKSSGSR